MGKRVKYMPKPFESMGRNYKDSNGNIRTDVSANIYESMLFHKAFTSLTPKQQVIYLYCKAQYYGHRKPSKDFPSISEVQGDECFYFNRKAVIDYGQYTEKTGSAFYRDMRALLSHGLIEKVVDGSYTKSKTIYRLSDKWQTWTEGTDYAPPLKVSKNPCGTNGK